MLDKIATAPTGSQDRPTQSGEHPERNDHRGIAPRAVDARLLAALSSSARLRRWTCCRRRGAPSWRLFARTDGPRLGADCFRRRRTMATRWCYTARSTRSPSRWRRARSGARAGHRCPAAGGGAGRPLERGLDRAGVAPTRRHGQPARARRSGRRDAAEHRHAVGLLRERYPQYETQRLEDLPIIRIAVERVNEWRARP